MTSPWRPLPMLADEIEDALTRAGRIALDIDPVLEMG